MNRYTQRFIELTAPDPYIIEANQKRINPSTEAELQSIEHEIGSPLPADYREFLSEYGGVWLGATQCLRAALYYWRSDYAGQATVSEFYSGRDLLEDWKESRQYIPDEVIRIADDGTFIRLFLAIKGEYKGSVYHSYPDWFPEYFDYYPELQLVARSFDDFVQMLEPLHENSNMLVEPTKMREVNAEASLRFEIPVDNKYSEIMASLQAGYVYATLNEKAKTLSGFELQAVEQEIQNPLPNDYREFLRSFGGYSLTPDAGIKFFHGVMGRDYHDLLSHYNRLKQHLPVGMLPIADAGEICLQVGGEQAGAIYKFESIVTEYSLSLCRDSVLSPLPKKLTLLAPSFDDFMRSLH